MDISSGRREKAILAPAVVVAFSLCFSGLRLSGNSDYLAAMVVHILSDKISIRYICE
jgi:hypothetical protein